jgi:hypothetical protein
MTLISTVMTANTSRTWMNPPNVEEVATPKSHKTSKTTKIVQSMLTPYFFSLAQLEAEAVNLKRAGRTAK